MAFSYLRSKLLSVNISIMSKLGIIIAFFLVILAIIPESFAQSTPVTVSKDVLASNAVNDTEKVCTKTAEKCKKGVILPLWTPVGGLSDGDKAARATVYMAAMIYMFLGVSIIADRFMAAIEVITSKEKEVVVKKPDGDTTVVNVRIWNETVSNLSLMALGSSAPEILLSVIEICGNTFEAGELGPSTIVGSAAFNLFIITAICVYCIPNSEVRRVKHLGVFFITATWSIFAYLWLYFILSVTSPGVVSVAEAVFTFLFFPGTVITAYIADRKILVYRFFSKKYRASNRKGVIVQSEGYGDQEMADGKTNHVGDELEFKGLNSQDSDVKEFEKHRMEYIEIMRELRKKHPNVDMKTLEEMAEYEVVNRGPKSRAFYRIQATRKLTGSGNVIKKSKIEARSEASDAKLDVKEEDPITKVYFDPGHYTVMENVGSFFLTVTREGGDLSKTVYVDYKTEDGTANAGHDFEYAEGTLVFYPLETHKQFSVAIIDDELFEEDEHFYVQLSNLRIGDSQGLFESDRVEGLAQIVNPSMATVMILDDDHPGIFHFEEDETVVTESIGEMHIKVVRSSGARGTVKIPYTTIDGTAKAGKDYELVNGELTFENDQAEQFIRIRIVDDEEYEKSENFFVTLGEPYVAKKGSDKKGIKGLLGIDTDSDDNKSIRSDRSIKSNRSIKSIKSNHSSKAPKETGGKSSDKDSGAEVAVEDEKLAELAKPRLGDIVKITVTIKESVEFKSVVDKLLKKANVSLVVGTSSWREQFVQAITVSAGDDDEEDSEEKLPSCLDYVMHFLTLFWKLLFAFVPPTDIWGGWACFWASIASIGLLTAFIGDLASGFGCTVGLKDTVTAISFVALGTSVPDTFASKVAAVNDQYADSSIGNVTGSNAVNVFLGIGVAWTIAAIYHAVNGRDFKVDPGGLAFSVTIFCVFAFLSILLLFVRRSKFCGGELGGPTKYRIPTVFLLVSFWLIYILLSSLVSYCYIKPF